MPWWLKQWWQQPDHFTWMTGYLQSHGILARTRVTMAAILGSLALVWSTTLAHPDSAAAAPALTAIGGAIVAAAMFARGWPNRRKSLILMICIPLVCALACLAQQQPLTGLTICGVFGLAGGYAAFFHTAGLLTYNFSVAAAVAIFETTQLAHAGSLDAAYTSLWMVAVINLSTPYAIQTIVHTLGADLLRSDRDPLTGLLNRRALRQRVLGLLAVRQPDMFLTVLMIDRDDFKALNDVHGHRAGDDALIAVADALRCAAASTTLPWSGVVAASNSSSSTPPKAKPHRRWRQNSAQTSPNYRWASRPASATANRSGRQTNSSTTSSGRRDIAMYEAKRSGGNRTRHRKAASLRSDDAPRAGRRSTRNTDMRDSKPS